MNSHPLILHEDSHILVCVKPPGIATQNKNTGKPDMVSVLKNYLVKHRTGSERAGEPYLAVIHRLDQPVWGIMVFAKTPYAARELNRELIGYGFQKHYRALVLDSPKQTEAVLENYLVKDARTNYSRICDKNTKGAKLAKLSYQVVTRSSRLFAGISPGGEEAVTELDIHLHTGRHHQIRVQLAGIGCPIAGDLKYNSKTQLSDNYRNLCLCSYLLEFTHPKSKKHMRFSLLQD